MITLDCKAPESWAAQLRKYADRVFRQPPPPYSKEHELNSYYWEFNLTIADI